MFPFQIGHAALKLVIPPRHFLGPKKLVGKRVPKIDYIFEKHDG